MIIGAYFNVQCQTLNEEEIFEIQDKGSLFQLGWIHVSVLTDFLPSYCYLYCWFTCNLQFNFTN